MNTIAIAEPAGSYQQVRETPQLSWTQKLREKTSQCWQSMNKEVKEVFGNSNIRIIKQKSWSEWKTLGNWLSSPDQILSKENVFVSSNWAPQFFSKVSDDLRSMKASTYSVVIDLVNTIDSLGQLFWSILTMNTTAFQDHGKEFLKNITHTIVDILSFFVMATQSTLNYVINTDGLNFIKGVIGILYSSLHATGSIGMALAELAQGNLNQAKEYASLFVKDLLNTFACLGHAIPSWAPLVIGALCPPVGVLTFIARVGKKCVGLPDLIGYGSTLFILWMDIKQQKDPEKKQLLEAQWNEMIEKIHPAKSSEGKVLSIAVANMAAEATNSLVSLAFGEHTGKLAKYSELGMGSALALGASYIQKATQQRKDMASHDLLAKA